MGVITVLAGLILAIFTEWFLIPLDILGLSSLVARARFIRENWVEKEIETREETINDTFADGVQDFTEPFGGWLGEIASGLFGIESSINGIADYLPNQAQDLKNVNIENPSLGGFEVKQLNEAINAIEGVYDVLGSVIGVFGGLIHLVLTPFAALAEIGGSFFLELASLSPIEAVSGLIGGLILVLVAAVAIPFIVTGLIELGLKTVGSVIRWAGSLVGVTEQKRPTSKILERATKSLVSRLVSVVVLVSIAISLVLYPFFNLLGLLVFFAITLLYLSYGEYGDRASIYGYGILISPIAVPAFFFELGFGLTGVVILYAATMIVVAGGTSYVEENAVQWATESPSGGN